MRIMEINKNTKLSDILAEYPWLPDELIKIDGRFRIVKTPVGKMMLKKERIQNSLITMEIYMKVNLKKI